MTTTEKPLYSSPGTAITCVTTSLTTDANLLAGRASTAIVNTTNLYETAILGGTIATTGTPTADTQIEIWLYGSWDNATTYTNAITGTDANFTVPGDASGNLKSQMAQACSPIPQYDATARTYTIGPIDVAAAFDFMVLPDHWGVFIVHNTGTTLGATTLTYQGINRQSV